MHEKDWQKARAGFIEARSIAERIGHPNGLWRAHFDMATLMDATGDRGSADEQRAKARSILSDSRQRLSDEHLAKVFGTAGQAHALLAD